MVKATWGRLLAAELTCTACIDGHASNYYLNSVTILATIVCVESLRRYKRPQRPSRKGGCLNPIRSGCCALSYFWLQPRDLKPNHYHDRRPAPSNPTSNSPAPQSLSALKHSRPPAQRCTPSQVNPADPSCWVPSPYYSQVCED